ncbi:MAG: DUF3995 domain-containing protein [Flavobacteriales bacterium]|nr:DUF3995 domain-containing protein [Flavobacteriales bacterium]
MILSIVLSSIFIGLGCIHFYWALGGKFGFSETLPTKTNGQQVLNPKRSDCLIVGLVLVLFGVFYLIKSRLITFELTAWMIQYASWIIPIIFIFRAIGEFKYVGFFKSIKGTHFSKMDTKIYSPLCLLMGILGITIHLFK